MAPSPRRGLGLRLSALVLALAWRRSAGLRWRPQRRLPTVFRRAGPQQSPPPPPRSETLRLFGLPKRRRGVVERRLSAAAALEADLNIDYASVTRVPLDAEGDFTHCVPADMTVDAVVKRLRSEREGDDEGEGQDTLFVVEANGQLLGELSCYELLTSLGNGTVRDFTREPEVVLIEEQVRRGDERAITEVRETEAALTPLVDDDGKLTRVMSAEDALLALTEGFEPQDATAEEPEIEGYFSATLFESIKARSRWLITLLLFQSLSSVILKMYEDTLSQHFVLALFLTMITGTAGNAGNQSTSLIIRGIATGEIGRKQVAAVILREFWAGLTLGSVLGIVAFARVLACPGAKVVDAVVVACSLTITVVAGVVMGTASPLLLKRLGVDPANSASPMLATLMDITGVLTLCIAGKFFLTAAQV